MNFYDDSPLGARIHKEEASLISLRRTRPQKSVRNLRTLLDPPSVVPPCPLQMLNAEPHTLTQILLTEPLHPPQTLNTEPPHPAQTLSMNLPCPLQMLNAASRFPFDRDSLLEIGKDSLNARSRFPLDNSSGTPFLPLPHLSARPLPIPPQINTSHLRHEETPLQAEGPPSLLETEKVTLNEELLNTEHSCLLDTLNEEPPCPFDRASADARDPYDWSAWARPEQEEPDGKWRLWLIMAGRGFGKTRTGAECVRSWVESNRYKRIGLIGATDDDIRHVMVEGCSGILSTYPPEDAPKYEPSKRQITWPNGTVAHLISAERFEKLRGRQFDAVWVDELAKFRYAQETWDQLALALRLGDHPKMIVTTTPRPTALIKRLSTPSAWSIITRGSTYANQANLAPGFIEHIQESCQNEKLLRQEIEGEIVDDVAGALWRHETLDNQRIGSEQLPEMQRVVVAVDPAIAHHDEGDETGIVVAGLGVDNKGYVLADLSGRYGTPGWAEQVLSAYVTFEADCIIAEENQGGALVEQVLRTIDPDVFYQKVHAARGKLARAEPVAALYARGRVHHVGTDLHHLERQLCTYVPGVSAQSPDRLDALVWAISSLMLNRLRPKKTRLWSMEQSWRAPEPSPPAIEGSKGIVLQ